MKKYKAKVIETYKKEGCWDTHKIGVFDLQRDKSYVMNHNGVKNGKIIRKRSNRSLYTQNTPKRDF